MEQIETSDRDRAEIIRLYARIGTRNAELAQEILGELERGEVTLEQIPDLLSNQLKVLGTDAVDFRNNSEAEGSIVLARRGDLDSPDNSSNKLQAGLWWSPAQVEGVEGIDNTNIEVATWNSSGVESPLYKLLNENPDLNLNDPATREKYSRLIEAHNAKVRQDAQTIFENGGDITVVKEAFHIHSNQTEILNLATELQKLGLGVALHHQNTYPNEQMELGLMFVMNKKVLQDGVSFDILPTFPPGTFGEFNNEPEHHVTQTPIFLRFKLDGKEFKIGGQHVLATTNPLDRLINLILIASYTKQNGGLGVMGDFNHYGVRGDVAAIGAKIHNKGAKPRFISQIVSSQFRKILSKFNNSQLLQALGLGDKFGGYAWSRLADRFPWIDPHLAELLLYAETSRRLGLEYSVPSELNGLPEPTFNHILALALDGINVNSGSSEIQGVEAIPVPRHEHAMVKATLKLKQNS